MKLLFDQNISYKVVKAIDTDFPGSTQVKFEHLNNATDKEIWEFAKRNGFCIVTFDADFYDLMMIKGFPPKIIWLRTGNASNEKLIKLLKSKKEILMAFNDDNEIGCIELRK
ncbi:MAG: DUF5615 family PIN-like protein [Vicingaceae bacterium]